MRRQVCWIARTEDGVKREVRVAFHKGGLRWQFHRSDREEWDYDSPPTAEDWDALLLRMVNRYQRRNVPYEELELVRRLRTEATGRE